MAESARTQLGKMVNGFNPQSDYFQLDKATQTFLQRRTQLLGPAYRLFYKKPVHITHGRGVLLYDKKGDEYLDAYNNVSSVGHANARVAAAVHRQMQTLCTNTRYLHDGILKYAEDLLATCDEDAGTRHAMFMCTGSEANDLAMRMAKHHTGRRGIIVTAEAYHGNSDLTASFSPSLGDNSPLGTWVRQIPPPDSYRNSSRNLGIWMADQVAAQIEDLKRHGEGLAAFVADSLFASDGIFSHPADVLGPVLDVVHRARGLFVADEVQSGFARSGERFWGYQRHHVEPDIITMGKPMGNGFPVAGVLVKTDVVKRFGDEVRYFNTFGGNAVAIAAAQATLDVIRDEGLQANADRVGQMLRNGIESLATRFEAIGDVRGVGLYIGVEIVKDRSSKQPDPQVASAIVNSLRDRRVLISATGYHANTLKIRPPLVFGEHDAVRLLTEMEHVLRSVH